MSETNASRKMRLVAVGAALLALVLTLVAVIVVLTRNGEQATAGTKASALTLSEHDVQASDVAKLKRDSVEIIIEKGATKGLRIKDASFATTLGLADGDVLTAISGKPLTRESDVSDAMSRISLMNPTTLYVEITRKDKPVLLRWRLDGNLREARYSSPTNVFGSTPPLYTPSAPSDPDPVLDGIEKIDEWHYKLPRKVVDAVLANPMAVAKGARVVPSVRNGQTNGFKIYAVRPSSIYAKLGFQNGDAIHAVNGHDLDSADDALELYTKLKDATSLTFDVTRRGSPVQLSIEITK
jgi:S1-C subfamily serine protease